MTRRLRLGTRTPLAHFVAIGVLLFGAERWWNTRQPAVPTPILVSGDTVDSLRRAWHEQFGREPDTGEARALVAKAVDEEILYREALASGFDRDDRIVRARLVELARFLGVAPGADPVALEGAARQLGLEQRDVIVRRHLAELARLALAKGDPLENPSEADLRVYYARHADRFVQPPRVQLTHVYLSAQHRGPAITMAATQLLDRFRREGIDPLQATAAGDPFIHGAQIPLSSRDEIERKFGPGFADAVETADLHTWVGPVRSSYGLHLVWIDQRLPTQAPSYEAVRNQVVHALLLDRSEQRLEQRLATLRGRYQVVTE